MSANEREADAEAQPRQCLLIATSRHMPSFDQVSNSPSDTLMHAIIELKSRCPCSGCWRIDLIIWRTFDVEIDEIAVRRVLPACKA